MPAFRRSNPELYFQRRVTVPRKITHHGWWLALSVVLGVSGLVYLRVDGAWLVSVGAWFGAVACWYISYLSLILREVAARTELNNAVLADMLHKAKDPALDRYWDLNAVYVEKDTPRERHLGR
jgi:hypothetical protein